MGCEFGPQPRNVSSLDGGHLNEDKPLPWFSWMNMQSMWIAEHCNMYHYARIHLKILNVARAILRVIIIASQNFERPPPSIGMNFLRYRRLLSTMSGHPASLSAPSGAPLRPSRNPKLRTNGHSRVFLVFIAKRPTTVSCAGRFHGKPDGLMHERLPFVPA